MLLVYVPLLFVAALNTHTVAIVATQQAALYEIEEQMSQP